VSFKGVFNKVDRTGSGRGHGRLGAAAAARPSAASTRKCRAVLVLAGWRGRPGLSAADHAATMVTEGVVCTLLWSNPISRSRPDARLAVAGGARLTKMLFGGIIACAKDDIKKSLAGPP